MRRRPQPPPATRGREYLGAPLGLAVAALAVWCTFGRGGEPASEFDLQLARAHLELIAAAPHPHGSPEQERLGEWIAQEIARTGLEPHRQQGTRTVPAGEGRARTEGAASPAGPARSELDPALTEELELTNLMARIEGRESSGALLLVAHYDSREETPGAADNGAAVACLLERLGHLAGRANAGERLRNDLIFLFTDGEELGLQGAQLFVDEHPWLEDVACVVNFDAIGNDGPVVLFQTGRASAHLVQHYARVTPHPVTTSLAALVYGRLPNDTDFTPFLEHGIPGLNLAIVGGGSAYHAPFDLPEHLAQHSLQRLGDTIALLAQALGEADLAAHERQAGSTTFFDLAGLGVVHWSPAATVTLFALALLSLVLGLGLALRRADLGPADLAHGLLAFASLAALTMLILALEWLLLRWLGSSLVSESDFDPRGNAGSTTLFFAGLTALAVSSSSWVMELLRQGPEADRRRRGLVLSAAALWIPGLLLLFALDAGACAQLPLVALLQGLSLALADRRPWVVPILGSVCVFLLAPHLALAFHLLSTNEMKAVGMFAVVVPAGSGILLHWLERHRPSMGLLIVLELAGSALIFLGGRLAALGA